MKIQRIELDGFGQLRDFSEELATGLHIFFGPNEAGKSTLQQAILALLYGFYETDRIRPAERSAQEHHVPWSGTPYRGRLVYELSDGRRFRIDRDFSTPDVATLVHDLRAGGRDVTDEYGRGRHGNLDFARKHIGMPKAVFEACAFVSQGELFDIHEKAKDVGDTIITLADSAGREASAQKAWERLEKVYKEDVGSPRARTTPLPLAQLRLEDLKRELAEIDDVRSQIAEDAAARDEAQARAESLRTDLRRTRYLLTRAEAEETQMTLAQLESLRAREEEALVTMRENQAYARFPLEERDAVQAQRTRIEQLEEGLKDKQELAEEQRDHIQRLAAEREGFARERRQLAHLGEFPVDGRRDVERLFAQWRAALTRADEERRSYQAVAHVADNLAEYESLEEAISGLTEQDIRGLYQSLSARPRGGLLATIRRLVGSILQMFRRLFGARPVPADSEHIPSVSRQEAERLLAERERWNTQRPQFERFRNARAALELAEAALKQADYALREALDDAGDDALGLERAYEVFVERCDGAQRLKQIDGQVTSIDREMEALSTAVQSFEEGERQERARREALTDQLRQLTGQDGPLEELLAAFGEGCRRRRAHDEAAQDLHATQEQRGMLLGGRAPEELRRALDDREREAADILVVAPSLQDARTHEPIRELSRRIEQTDNDLRAVELRIRGFTTKIDTELGKLRPRAEVEEEIERSRREVAKLEGFRQELEIAMQAINEAAEEAHRDFAPHVGGFLSGHMAQVTSGRYRDMYLDATTLKVRVEVPETRHVEEIEKLSRGTRTAAYLLLRIGLTQYMSSIHEPVPLILDDPLVDLDGVRQENFLELLLSISTKVQVLLFTKSDATRRWFEARCRGNPSCSATVLVGQSTEQLADIAPAPLVPSLTNGHSEDHD